jgi:hypothetical protein
MAPLEELDYSTKGLEGWHGANLLWNCSIPITNTKGSYLYPCPNTTPSRPRVQHLLPKLMPQRQCLSCTRHQFVPSLHSGHVITYSRMLPFPSAKQPFLPNDGVLPTAGTFTECFEENFLTNGVFLPNSAHKSVCFLCLFLVLTYAPSIRGWKWFYSEIDHKCSTSPSRIRSTPVLSSLKPLEFSPRSKP